MQVMALHVGADQYTGSACSTRVHFIVVGNITNAVNKAGGPGQWEVYFFRCLWDKSSTQCRINKAWEQRVRANWVRFIQPHGQGREQHFTLKFGGLNFKSTYSDFLRFDQLHTSASVFAAFLATVIQEMFQKLSLDRYIFYFHSDSLW